MKPAPVKHIPVRNIDPNPHNPRRLFDEEPMKILRESIEKLGILVPVTVYPAEKRRDFDIGKDRFVLLDGERRWRCAKELEYREIPAVIVDQPSEERNILTMFHIHNVREGWQLMPTAQKLQTLMDRLEEANERKLAELTKLSVSQIRRCKILLSFPKKFQNMMLAPPSERMKADFFIELHRIRRPALEKRFPPWIRRGDSNCIDIFLKKYLGGTIQAVTEFRTLAEIYRGSVRKKKVQQFLREMDRLLRIPEMGIRDVDVPGATFEKEVKEIRRSGKRLLNQLKELDPEAMAADVKVLQMLQTILKTIKSKLAKALVVESRDVTQSED